MSQYESVHKQRAAALKYDPEKNGAPVIVASGMGYTAERITEAAMRAGVPVYEDDSLATLLTQLKMGSEIPKELFQAIVEIYVYFLGFGSKLQEGEGTEANASGEGASPAAAESADGTILAAQAEAKGMQRTAVAPGTPSGQTASAVSEAQNAQAVQAAAAQARERSINPSHSGLSTESAAAEIAAAAASSVKSAGKEGESVRTLKETAWAPQRYRADGTKVEDGGR